MAESYRLDARWVGGIGADARAFYGSLAWGSVSRAQNSS